MSARRAMAFQSQCRARSRGQVSQRLRTATPLARKPSRSKCLHAAGSTSAPPRSTDRGPKSAEKTQTDFGAMDMLGHMPAPSTAVDACMDDGFALNSGLKVVGGGVLLVGGEAFTWRPWVKDEGTMSGGAVGGDVKGGDGVAGKLQNAKGQWDVDGQAWGVLDVVWPKPDLLVLGTGPSILPLSPATRKHIADLGIRVEVQDTRNAAAQFNLLATERGLEQVAAALIPIGWREGR